MDRKLFLRCKEIAFESVPFQKNAERMPPHPSSKRTPSGSGYGGLKVFLQPSGSVRLGEEFRT